MKNRAKYGIISTNSELAEKTMATKKVKLKKIRVTYFSQYHAF